jgi:hypothetical protein
VSWANGELGIYVRPIPVYTKKKTPFGEVRVRRERSRRPLKGGATAAESYIEEMSLNDQPCLQGWTGDPMDGDYCQGIQGDPDLLCDVCDESFVGWNRDEPGKVRDWLGAMAGTTEDPAVRWLLGYDIGGQADDHWRSRRLPTLDRTEYDRLMREAAAESERMESELIDDADRKFGQPGLFNKPEFITRHLNTLEPASAIAVPVLTIRTVDLEGGSPAIHRPDEANYWRVERAYRINADIASAILMRDDAQSGLGVEGAARMNFVKNIQGMTGLETAWLQPDSQRFNDLHGAGSDEQRIIKEALEFSENRPNELIAIGQDTIIFKPSGAVHGIWRTPIGEGEVIDLRLFFNGKEIGGAGRYTIGKQLIKPTRFHQGIDEVVFDWYRAAAGHPNNEYDEPMFEHTEEQLAGIYPGDYTMLEFADDYNVPYIDLSGDYPSQMEGDW